MVPKPIGEIVGVVGVTGVPQGSSQTSTLIGDCCVKENLRGSLGRDGANLIPQQYIWILH